ncbi:RHS repeat-associated core domain-containing protein [Dehalobacterium formicoaceticum]|nr:RHS repeat-associated core domain-containing protein [Dehalobacterium formicoaceticum]
MLYAGEYYDEESGLYYLRARYYDPTEGRFISEYSNEGKVTNPLSLN